MSASTITTNVARFWIVRCPACHAARGKGCLTRTGAFARRSHDARIMLADGFRQRSNGQCVVEVSPELPLVCDLDDYHDSVLHFDKTAAVWWRLDEESP